MFDEYLGSGPRAHASLIAGRRVEIVIGSFALAMMRTLLPGQA